MSQEMLRYVQCTITLPRSQAAQISWLRTDCTICHERAEQRHRRLRCAPHPTPCFPHFLPAVCALGRSIRPPVRVYVPLPPRCL
eukprot:scaffold35676_cov101-Isochrysis_galbana.AAC.1